MRILTQGMRGSEVAVVQTHLIKSGYKLKPIDGIFGSMTLGAVLQFQNARGLKPDGIVGPVTYNELQKSVDPQNESSTPTRRPSVAGWIPYWLQAEAFAVIQNNSDLFTTLSPFWYELTSQGDLIVFPNAEDPAILRFAKKIGIAVIPLIANSYNSQPVSTVLNDPILRQRHIQTIVNTVFRMGYDGIEIDYENLFVTDKEVFVLFLQELKVALGLNKKVVATLMAKATSVGNTGAATSHDYYGIGQAVDIVRIMAYDYSWTKPGPIAPADWVKQVLDYAVTLIPREKLEVGLPTYGYDWGAKKTGVSYLTAINTAERYTAQILQDRQNGPHYTYTDTTGIPHEVWFTNALNFKTLLDIAQQLKLRGISVWHPGNDDPNIYKVIRNS
ncbi:MAG TPA: glycosyl hydrolase family 18 protein [Desulfosporosinus sp.]|nr:glycosyl hydrolase family 18 protein [Desulfosporosinus sp.]